MRSKVKVTKRATRALDHLDKINVAFEKGDGGVMVGLPAGSNAYPDGTSVIMVGNVHEFGSPSQGIRQRSFLRAGVHRNRRKYEAMIKQMSIKIARGEMSGDKAMGLLGLSAQTDVREEITNLKTPKLKRPRKRGALTKANPLVDTGHLRQSITFVKRDKNAS